MYRADLLLANRDRNSLIYLFAWFRGEFVTQTTYSSVDMLSVTQYSEGIAVRKNGNHRGTKMSEPLLTSADLVSRAQAHGYLLKPDLFRQWISRGLFPKARDTIARPGKPGRANVWYEQDSRYLLTLCWLHAQNCRSDEIRLGLWLAGYADFPAQEVLCPLLVEQLQLIARRLTGSRSSEPRAYTEEELEGAINPRLERLIQESTVSAQVVWGVSPSLPEVYYREVFAIPAHQTVPEAIEHFMWPAPATEHASASYPHPQLTEIPLLAERLTMMQAYQLIDMLSCLLGIPCAETDAPEADPSEGSGKPRPSYLYAAGTNLLTIPQAIAALQRASSADCFFLHGTKSMTCCLKHSTSRRHIPKYVGTQRWTSQHCLAPIAEISGCSSPRPNCCL